MRLQNSIIAEILSLHSSGTPTKDIATKFNIFTGSVSRILRKNGVMPNKHIITDDDKQYIIKRYQEDNISSEIIAAEFAVSSSTICRLLKSSNITLRPPTSNKIKHNINENIFSTIETENSAYFLGILYSANNINSYGNRVQLSLNDPIILEKLSHIIYGFNKTSNNILSFNSKIIHSDLVNVGCMSKAFPKLSSSIIHHFIRGYFDGSDNSSISKQVLFDRFSDNISQFIDLTKPKDFIDFIYKDATIYIKSKYDACIESIKSHSNVKRKLKSEENADDFAKYGTSHIPTFNGTQLSKKNIAKMSDEQLADVGAFTLKFYRENGFPYTKLNDTELLRDFAQLKSFNQDSILEEGNIITLFNPRGINIFKHFSPHFFEMQSGLRNDKPSMVAVFEDDILFARVIKNRLDQRYQICGNMIKQGLCNSRIAFKGSIFNPMVAKFIYNKYTKEGDIIYDYSMGYGQRLLAALSLDHNVKYIGVDPYKKSVISNQNIFDYFKKNIGFDKEADIVCSGSEDYCDEKYIGKVGLAFSSPPYFCTEMYEEDKSQAGFNKNYAYFINEWWAKTVNNIDQLLTGDGIFILNMKEIVLDLNILEDMSAVIYKKGFKKIETFMMQLSRNSVFRYKEATMKYEPIVVFQK
jgi:hypothetical protein